LNVTRSAMASFGYCPSGRLFEAAACATPVVSDSWDGLGEFFEPGREILVASSADDVVNAIGLDDEELRRIGRAARERVFSEHTADHRSREFLQLAGSAA
jgi:spore maturation protein CgeB